MRNRWQMASQHRMQSGISKVAMIDTKVDKFMCGEKIAACGIACDGRVIRDDSE